MATPRYPNPLAQNTPHANHTMHSNIPPQSADSCDELRAEVGEETHVSPPAMQKVRPKSGLMSRYLAPPSFSRRGAQTHKADKRKGALFPSGIITRTDEYDVEISEPRGRTQDTLLGSPPYSPTTTTTTTAQGVVVAGEQDNNGDVPGDSSLGFTRVPVRRPNIHCDAQILLRGKPLKYVPPVSSPTSPAVFPSRKMRVVEEKPPSYSFNLRSPTLASLSSGFSPSTSTFHSSSSRKTSRPLHSGTKPHALRFRGAKKHDLVNEDAPEWYRMYQEKKREQERLIKKEDKKVKERRKKEEKAAEKAARREKEKSAREKLGREGMFVDPFLLG